MKKIVLASAVLALLGVSLTMSVMAQPPRGDQPPGDRPPGGERPDGPPGERGDGPPGHEGRPPMVNPFVAALDTDGDHEISADEIKAASASLLTLDKNGDGKLTDDETRPPHPEGGPGGGRGEGPPGGPGGGGRGEGPPGGGGPGGGRGQMGPPNPERLVEEAMHFDADGDGKLDKTELTKFATEFANRPRPNGGGGPSGQGGGRGPGAGGPPGGGGGRGAGGNQEGDRPRRPTAE